MAKRPLRNTNNNKGAKGPKGQRRPNTNNKGVKARPKLKAGGPNKVQDARNKLIARKRNKVVDARDVLARMAKMTDARAKINKLRQGRGGNTGSPGIKVIGSGIVKKTDRAGNISLVTTNKHKMAPVQAMSAAIQKELGALPAKNRYRDVKNEFMGLVKTVPVKRPQIRRPVLNELDYATYSAQLARSYESPLYKWSKPGLRGPASQMISSLETRGRVHKETYINFPVNNRSMRVSLDAMEDEEMPMVSPLKQTISLQGSSRISNIHSRLDITPIEPESHGILAPTKTKVVVPAGHRIVVSNLQATVTQDDVKELFEDIGQLLAARLVRPGVAEVIYKNLKDAQKAVDTYHNRQLDGQPMKCLLVNKRPVNNPLAPPLTKMESQGFLSMDVVPSASNTSKLVPDLSTIHKVLFQRK